MSRPSGAMLTAMPPRKHNLPDGYDRLSDKITGPVADSIVVYPRSHGLLRLPGQHSTGQPHPRHETKVTATGPDGYYVEEVIHGSPECYTVSYDVWSYKDSPLFADLILLEDESPPGKTGGHAEGI
jgi:hypothetical protein